MRGTEVRKILPPIGAKQNKGAKQNMPEGRKQEKRASAVGDKFLTVKGQ